MNARTPNSRDELEAAVRRAIVAITAVDPKTIDAATRLNKLLADSLAAVAFAARLESELGGKEVPFELWVQEHAESTDRLTVGALVEWLAGLPALRGAPPLT
jgi:acyl carrier protein